MILYAILGLLFIAMVVLAVLSAKKDWHWLNPVLLVFIFIAGSAGMIGMAQTLHLRRTAVSAVDKQLKRVTQAEENRQKFIFGDISSAEYGPESLRGRSQQLELMQLGRGREWAGGTVANVGGQIVFTFAAEQPEVEDENMSLENVELFAFADQPLRFIADGEEFTTPTPVAFVGKFLVIQESTTTLTLSPSVPIADFQEYGAPQAVSWTLYERMPFDRHGVIREVAKMTGDNFDIAKFRQFLMQSAFIPNQIGLDPASAAYERLIDEFSFDGLSIGEIDSWVEKSPNRVSPRFEPEPTEVFVRYKFNGNSTETYTVDDKAGKLDTDGTFSVQGHAVDPLLQLSPGAESRDVSFKKDDIVEIDLQTVEGYQRPDGTSVPPFTDREPNVEEVNRIFRRKLVDFPFEMTKLYNRRSQVDNETNRLVSNNEVQDTALADLLKQQQDRTREKVAYDNDNKLLRNDLDQISARQQQVDQRVADNTRKIEMLITKVEELRRSVEMRAQSLSSSTR